jgi:hypothetical protein
MSELFGFESDFVASLRCIPMAVRYRLDLAGVKLRLNEWSRLGQADRRRLLDLPVSGPGEAEAYRESISAMVAAACGARPALLPEPPDPVWESPAVPEQVRGKAAESGVALNDAAWQYLSPLQRFALVKLSRPGHENRNFVPAAEEFGLPRA